MTLYTTTFVLALYKDIPGNVTETDKPFHVL